MSKGISWRQRSMLESMLRLEKVCTPSWSKEPWPVAWRELDYGPTDETVFFTPRGQWNIEQATRRALRSLERRGLIKLGRYSFMADADEYGANDPDEHTPGRDRWMTGVLLTPEGRKAAANF